MAKSKYETVILPRFNEIKRWVTEGLTDREIIGRLGISRSTWYKHKSKFYNPLDYCPKIEDFHPEVIEAEKEGKKFDERRRWSVYKHIFPNGKVYIGITSNSPTVRWRSGKGYGKSQPLMYNAIHKYGWENVDHEILFTGLTEREAKTKEIELIAKFKSDNVEHGYNISKGGEGGTRSRERICQMRADRGAKKANGGVSYSFDQILEKLDVIEELARKGYSKEVIASHFGISRETLHQYETLNSDISDAIQRGRSVAIGELENTMFKLAQGYTVTLQKTMKVRDPGGGEHLEDYEEDVHVPPNFNALRFLLTNWSENYANDPAMIRQRKEEFEHKKKIDEENSW